MPYKCIQEGGNWKCVSEDTGRVHGTHHTKGECQAQLRALYKNANPKDEK